MENVPVVWPGETVTVAGTDAAELLLVRLTTIPDGPAGLPRVTVAAELAPPCKVVGFRLNPDSAAGLIVRVAV